MLAIAADAKIIHHGSWSAPFTNHPDVVVDSFWVNYDQLQDVKKGMLVHMKLTVFGLKDIDCAVAIFFLYGFDKPIKDKNKSYYSTAGNVAVFKDIKPVNEDAVFNDLQVFMPYDELDLDPGSYKLKMDIDLAYSDGTRIQHLKYLDFRYIQESTVGKNSSKIATANTERPVLTKKDLLIRVKNILAKSFFHVKPETIKMQSSFRKDLGADDLDVVMLYMEIDEEFGVKISNQDQDQITTVQHLYYHLIKKLRIAR